MSTTTSADDSDDVPQIVERLQSAFDDVREYHTDPFRKDEVDGQMWGTKYVAILGSEMSGYGEVPLDSYVDAEYVRTQSVDDDSNGGPDHHRCYGFSDGNHIHWVNVEYVRTLANDVFDVSYDEIKSWAKITSTEPLQDHNDSVDDGHDGAVLFDPPHLDYRAVVAPVLGPDE
jgi:hypothetical protein